MSLLCACAAALSVEAGSACAIVTTNTGGTPFNGINVNAFVGAESFYALGYTGTRAVVANVEAGHIWDGHDNLAPYAAIDEDNNLTLTPRISQYINHPSIGSHETLYDWHATMVGHTLGGLGEYYGFIFQDASGNLYNMAFGYGIAPLSELWSGAIASAFNPETGSDFTGSFEVTQASFNHAYVTTMQTGVNGRRADVINSSWGYDDPSGTVNETGIIDALAYANRQTVVLAAGNHSSGNPAVSGPASGYNSITVAALASDTSDPWYGYVANFSNHGVNDFVNPKATGPGTVPASRVTVDVAAPGDNFTLAAYLGLTGGHTSNDVFQLTPDTLASTGNYFLDMGGTSFASPVVAGAAALVVDMGYDRFAGGTSVDGRVVKAVLLNSARKIAGWDNGQGYDSRGVLRTDQALDESTGTGMLDLRNALLQYAGGTTDVPGTDVDAPVVSPWGWDYAVATPGLTNDYYIGETVPAGTPLSVTLTWFVNRAFDETTSLAADVAFADLDLEVWFVLNGLPVKLVASSESPYSNVEHLAFPVTIGGRYMVRVKYFGDAYSPDDPSAWSPEGYAVAWMVPEPSAPLLLLLMTGAWVSTLRPRSRPAASTRDE
jgi:hypothetical protein